MPTNVFAPAVPHNDRNYSYPSRISAWFRGLCPNGSLTAPVELGSISDISLNITETTQEAKSFRLGKNTTSRREITDVSGTLTFKLHEMAGSNINLLFRPSSSIHRTGGSGKLLYGQSRVRLTGTNAAVFAPDAVEYDPASGLVSYPSIEILRVEALAIADPTTGRATQYVAGDYTFVQVAGTTTYRLRINTTASAVIPDIGASFTIADTARAFNGGTGTFVAGETVTTDAGGTTALLVGVIYTSATTGFLLLRNITGGTFDNTDTLVGVTSGAGGAVLTASNPAATTATVVRYEASSSTVIDVICTIAGGITAVQLDSLVAQAAADSDVDGVAVSATGGYTGIVSVFEPAGAGTQATIARSGSSNIPDGSEAVVLYQYRRAGIEYSIGEGIQIEGELQLQVLSLSGPQSVYTFNRVNLNMEGEVAFNPDERMMPTLQATILPDGTGQRGSFTLLDGFGSFSTVQCA